MAAPAGLRCSLRPHHHWRLLTYNRLAAGKPVDESLTESQLSHQLVQPAGNASSSSHFTDTLGLFGTQWHSTIPSLYSHSAPTLPSSSHATDTIAPLCSWLNLLAVTDSTVSLPPLVSDVPLVPPPALPCIPQRLPQSEISAPTIVEPYTDLEPQLLPEHTSQTDVTKHCRGSGCTNMLRVRKKKMKKHKRYKERKRNRVSHEQRILRDIARKEKNFMAAQMSLLHEAEAFDAEKHVKDILARVNHRPIPKFWRGKRLHEATVIKLMHKAGLKVPGIDK